jgi:hypothetical protein
MLATRKAGSSSVSFRGPNPLGSGTAVPQPTVSVEKAQVSHVAGSSAIVAASRGPELET